MAYNAAKPADTQFIAAGPKDIRDNFEAIRTEQIVDAGKLKGLVPGNATGNIPVANGTVCTNLNTEKHGGNLPSAYATAGHTHTAATTSSNGLMSNTDKTKLDGIAVGAQTNQMAFSNVLVGSTTIQADSATDTLTLIAGTNISLAPDATNDAVTIGVTGTVASATTAAACTGNAATATTATTTTGNAGTATKLATARTIAISGKVTGTATSFDGSAAISIPITAVTADSCTGNSATATTANTCSGNAATATKLATARTIAGVSFDGTTNIAIPYSGLTGTPTIPTDTAYDAGHSFAANGYQKLSNGFILQWGTISIDRTAWRQVTLPFPVLNGILHIPGTVKSDVGLATDVPQVRNLTKTGFEITNYWINPCPYSWFAICY
jgi:hypothetical protein